MIKSVYYEIQNWHLLNKIAIMILQYSIIIFIQIVNYQRLNFLEKLKF